MSSARIEVSVTASPVPEVSIDKGFTGKFSSKDKLSLTSKVAGDKEYRYEWEVTSGTANTRQLHNCSICACFLLISNAIFHFRQSGP
jgi:hypothetical protein